MPVIYILSCNPTRKKSVEGFEISGKVTGIKSDSVYLYNWLTNKRVATVVTNGNFYFEGHVDYPEMYQIQFNSQMTVFRNVFVENSKITVTGSADSSRLIKIEGSAIENEFAAYRGTLKSITDSMDQLNNKIDNAQNKKDYDLADSFTDAYNRLGLEELERVYTYAHSNPHSVMIPYITSQAAMNAADSNLIAKIFLTMDPELQSNPRVQGTYDMLKDFKKGAIGTNAPDFDYPSNEGKPVKLSSFLNKVILLDFWASWCKPCRENNPDLLNLYKKFKSNNFEIIGFSIDKNNIDWKNAIQKDKLTWPQVDDLDGPDGKTPKDYGIYWVPTIFLIDKHGKIAAKNIYGKKLNTKIEELMTVQ